MKRIPCLVLPLLLAAGCGDSGAAKPDAPPSDAPPEASKLDATIPDAPAKLDAYVGTDLPLPRNDGPAPTDGDAESVDAVEVVDHHDQFSDAPERAIDTGEGIDVPPVAVDGPGAALDVGKTDAWLVTSPDGRVFTVVDACQLGPLGSSSSCPTIYAEGLAKVQSPLDASPFPPYSHTGAGRCSEGSYVYAPYLDTSALGCYYDASTQQLVGVVTYSDTTYPCGKDDTVSFAFVNGTKPPCTDITWEAYR